MPNGIPDYTAEIDAIRYAIGSGATRVSYDGKSVEYDTYKNLLARLAFLERLQFGVAGYSGSRLTTFDRGDGD
jgi:hypothetical protein